MIGLNPPQSDPIPDINPNYENTKFAHSWSLPSDAVDAHSATAVDPSADLGRFCGCSFRDCGSRLGRASHMSSKFFKSLRSAASNQSCKKTFAAILFPKV